jgi:hypothetical protein
MGAQVHYPGVRKRRFDVKFLRGIREEKHRQAWYIVSSLSQGREMNMVCRKAVKQIFSERSVCYGFLQIFVRCGNDPDINGI